MISIFKTFVSLIFNIQYLHILYVDVIMCCMVGITFEYVMQHIFQLLLQIN